MKTSMKFLLALMAALVISVFCFNIAEATSTTYTLAKVRYNDITVYEKAALIVGSSDVAIFTINASTPTGGTSFGDLYIGVSRTQSNDVTDLQVRYQYSYNGSDYVSVTIGTDSTTWVTNSSGFTGTSYGFQRVQMAIATYPDAPYKRLQITAGGDADSIKVKVAMQPILR